LDTNNEFDTGMQSLPNSCRWNLKQDEDLRDIFYLVSYHPLPEMKEFANKIQSAAV